MAGLHKHKWSYTVKYAPDHFGSNKWQPPNRVLTNRWINLKDLANLAGESGELDLGALGYDKLLGQGSVLRAYKVKVPRASGSAVEKIKAAGGSIEVLEGSETEEEKKSPEKMQPPVQKK
jgi:large subunit ribosomal protein L15